MVQVLIISLFTVLATIMIWKRNLAKRQVREACWATVILWGAGALQTAIALHLPISLPTDWISITFEPIYVPIVEWIKGG
ncbi:hypothetical protein RB620_16155 [Paenibacillus sp. LHD-117]|uniref:hypothetical protein n=1 Tax=Paenibacillus sp. LHD-117 TaxID=3071412 RepID=UPI0027E1B0F7|nr:hypothetical protein [Paenibacillus sp. LHD-117]MDQ6420962.1 hypothetical protein [Paenibacillus sp. LHD-117]